MARATRSLVAQRDSGAEGYWVQERHKKCTRTFLLTADAMMSLLVWSRLSTACAAPLVTLKVDPFGALMVASVLCSHHPKVKCWAAPCTGYRNM